MGFGFWEALIVSVFCIVGVTGFAGFGFMLYSLITDKRKDDKEPN